MKSQAESIRYWQRDLRRQKRTSAKLQDGWISYRAMVLQFIEKHESRLESMFELAEGCTILGQSRDELFELLKAHFNHSYHLVTSGLKYADCLRAENVASGRLCNCTLETLIETTKEYQCFVNLVDEIADS